MGKGIFIGKAFFQLTADFPVIDILCIPVQQFLLLSFFLCAGLRFSQGKLSRRQLPYRKLCRSLIQGIERIDLQPAGFIQGLHGFVPGKGSQHPVQIGLSLRPQPIGQPFLFLFFQQSPACQFLFQPGDGAGQHQPLLCPGQRHIEDPQFFPQAFQGNLLLDCFLQESFGPYAQFFVHAGCPNAQIRMEHDAVSGILQIDLLAHAADKDNGKLQTFAAVDAHDLHTVVVF